MSSDSSKTDNLGSHLRYILAKCCMPTLLGKKPASIINIQKRHVPDQAGFLALLRQELAWFHTDYIILYEGDASIFVFIYQSEMLSKVLGRYQEHLLMNAYSDFGEQDSLLDSLKVLKERFWQYRMGRQEFPHEMGLFLGYPIHDVEEYIYHEGKNYLFCGYWKVYDNLDKAVGIFRLYDRYKEAALRLFQGGRELREINSYL